MTTPTHDLAIARAERDAWQSTCEELHRTIAGRDVEIEAHLGRCEAADQRARSLDAALTAEREASKGLVAQVDALRKDLAHAQERLAERRTAQRGEVERLEAERAAQAAIPRPPEFTLRYLGNFGPGGRRIAVFSDGGTIYNAFEGDVLEGRFEVARIGYESVEIRYVGFPDVPALRVGISG